MYILFFFHSFIYHVFSTLHVILYSCYLGHLWPTPSTLKLFSCLSFILIGPKVYSSLVWIIIDYSKMVIESYSLFIYMKLDHDVCYQAPIENNIFVFTNKGKVLFIRPSKLHICGNHFMALGK